MMTPSGLAFQTGVSERRALSQFGGQVSAGTERDGPQANSSDQSGQPETDERDNKDRSDANGILKNFGWAVRNDTGNLLQHCFDPAERVFCCSFVLMIRGTCKELFKNICELFRYSVYDMMLNQLKSFE